MKLAVWLLRLTMPAANAEALAGDLAEDLARRWRAPALRVIFLVMLAAAYASAAAIRRAGRAVDWLDMKLGMRMLVRYPGLTIISVFSMAIAIALGAGVFGMHALLSPRIPLPDGDRLVSIENWDAAADYEERQLIHDFVTWRDEVRTLTDVGAFREIRRNLITEDGAVEAVTLAEMSAAGFRAARVPALKGRTLDNRDERADAPPVLVIGEAVWRGRFNADPAILGRVVRVGSIPHTVVGVMPGSFAFPINHRLWVPLKIDPSRYKRREGPALYVFAKIAPGATVASAKAELALAGQRAAELFPETNARLRPRLMPYSVVFVDVDGLAELPLMQAAVTLLLLVIAVNVAILIYARTATRAAEIAVRTALGASRRRIVAQLFVEACVLAAVATAIALLVLKFAFVQMESVFVSALPEGLPFWLDFRVSATIMSIAAGLALVAAMIAGVIPALKVTGRRAQASLQSLASRGAGLRLGKAWTALVIAQVALTVALLPAATVVAYASLKHTAPNPGYAAEKFAMASLGMDWERPSLPDGTYGPEYEKRFRELASDLANRLSDEPGVTAVTMLWAVPGREPTIHIEFDTTDSPGGDHTVRFTRVETNHFDVFGARLLAGRTFTPGDAAAVVVNQRFVDDVAAGQSVLGRRIRYQPRSGGPGAVAVGQDGVELPGSYEIVGVVENVPAPAFGGGMPDARVYLPLVPDMAYRTLAVGVGDDQAAALAGRVRALAGAIDPALRVNRVAPMIDIFRGDKTEEHFGAVLMAGITAATLLLACGGVYALMSVTITRRRREIGIRAALGGEPKRILAAILGRAGLQLGAGAAIGAIPALMFLPGGDVLSQPPQPWETALLLAGAAIVLIVVGLIAVYGPARRGLRIQPTEALRGDG